MSHYLYLFETFDEPSEHLNAAGDVIGALAHELAATLGDDYIGISVPGMFAGELDEYHGDCCEGYDVPDDFACDGFMSENLDRIIVHNPYAWETDTPDITPDVIDEYFYTVVDVECRS